MELLRNDMLVRILWSFSSTVVVADVTVELGKDRTEVKEER